ncbi:MAG: SGNH/GDSL hydrolase family protein, partial [Parasporobacterium sp.]|nr:SGNH/GDSL hydrolase family protein [Parasporobacterium sp.]
DYYVAGPSTVFYNVNPLVIWNEAGYTGCNVASEQAPLIISYYELKNEFAKRIPKAVFLDCMALTYNYGTPSFNQLSLDKMQLNGNKIELILKLGEDDENHQIKKRNEYSKINYLLPLYKFHDRWKEIFDGTLKSRYHSSYEHTFMGYVAEKNVHVYDKDYKWLPTQEELGGTSLTEVSPLNREYVKKIHDLCSENGVVLVLFRTPSKMWTKEMNEAAKQLAQEEGLPFFDMDEEEILNELNIDEKKDFADDFSHLNIYGSEKVSRYLANYMKQMGIFSDKRGQNAPIEAAWDQMYQEYLAYKEG